MKILFLSRWFPYPPINGSTIRVYNLLRRLSQFHELTLISFADHHTIELPPQLKALCGSIHVVEYRPYNPSGLQALLGFFSTTPRAIVSTHEPRMAKCIQEEIHGAHYDLVIASELDTAAYSSTFTGVPGILDDLELGLYESAKRQARTSLQRLRHELTLVKLRHYVQDLLPRFSACTVVSEAEGSLLRRTLPTYKSVEVIPNCVSLADYGDVKAEPQPDTLIFTGSFRYSVNHDAMNWFLGEVYPLVQVKVPRVRMTITGDHANLPLPRVGNVTLSGFVDDVRPVIASSWISLVPIRRGGGTRLKILEAMALRTPVVATSKGAEGLEVRHDEHLLIADSPAEFAEAVVRLLKDLSLRERLTTNAYHLVSERYDSEVVVPRFLGLVDRVANA